MRINYQIEPSELKKTEAIFCDVDGTLINSKLEIDSFTKKEIMEFKDKIPFILTSGRTYKALKAYHDQLELSTPYITLYPSYIESSLRIRPSSSHWINGTAIQSITNTSEMKSVSFISLLIIFMLTIIIYTI